MKRKGQQAGKPTDHKCHWCGGSLNLSGHSEVMEDGQQVTTTYLVGVDCMVRYADGTDLGMMTVAVPCEHQMPYEQLGLFGGSDFTK